MYNGHKDLTLDQHWEYDIKYYIMDKNTMIKSFFCTPLLKIHFFKHEDIFLSVHE